MTTTNKSLPIVGDMLREATARLMGVSGAPRLDAGLLLGHVVGVTREALITHPERPLTATESATFQKLLTLRIRGMPIAYLLGSRPFYDRVFRVSPGVLIPRPETENLVEAALAWAAGRDPLTMIDVGTGAGVIGVTLAAHLPSAQVIATDISPSALAVACDNGADVPNIRFVAMDLMAAFPARPLFDLVASNLPYIASAEMNILEVAKFEPNVALDGGPDGLTLIRRLLESLPPRIRRPGLVLLEHGADQGLAVATAATAVFPNESVKVIKDDAGLDRFVQIELLD